MCALRRLRKHGIKFQCLSYCQQEWRGYKSVLNLGCGENCHLTDTTNMVMCPAQCKYRIKPLV